MASSRTKLVKTPGATSAIGTNRRRLASAGRVESAPSEEQIPLGKQENGSGDRTKPMIIRAAFGCGRDRRAVNDQAAVFVYLFALVPRGLWIKIQTEGRGQHGRGEILGLFTARLRGHAVSVQLRYIAIHVRVRRSGQTKAGVDMTPEFIGL